MKFKDFLKLNLFSYLFDNQYFSFLKNDFKKLHFCLEKVVFLILSLKNSPDSSVIALAWLCG